MAEAKKKDSRSGTVKVLVEMQVPKGQDAAQSLKMAMGFGATGFQVDYEYEPVPAGPPTDPKLAMELEEKREETIIVRGTVDADRIEDLKAQPNILGVWPDTEIAPFGNGEAGEEGFALEPGQASGKCPIPPCDCDQGTAACSKGTLADVRRYLGVDRIWAAGIRGQGIVIGIVDGGITAAGRVTGGTIPRVIGGWPAKDWGTKAAWGRHGNMTATDALGMADRANIYDIRISDGNAISNALAGFQWAITRYKKDGTPHILSNSWGIWQESWDRVYARDPNHPFTRKVVEAVNEGIIVLFAAGNCGEGCAPGKCGKDVGPGRSIWGANGHPLVMTVGAANIRGRLIGYSSQGPASLDPHKPDFCSISHFTGYFPCDTGTSAACPVAAGVVALLKQCNPSLSPQRAKNVLKQTAKNIGPHGWDQHSGSGIIQAKAAYDLICRKPPRCRKYRVYAARYLELYRRTKNRKYLCLYYRYLGAYYCCLYRATKNRKYLCACYRYYAAYFRCMYRITKKRKYLCLYYRYLGAYYCCLYRATKNRKYLCACYRYYAAYFRCVYRITKKRKYLCLYYRYLGAYYCCMYRISRNKKHLLLCKRYTIAARKCR